MPCCRCGRKPSYSQWSICADGNQYRVICAECDWQLNEMVLKWMNMPEADEKLARYKLEISA